MADAKKPVPFRLRPATIEKLDAKAAGNRQAFLEALVEDFLAGRLTRTAKPARVVQGDVHTDGAARAEAFRRMKPPTGIIGGKTKEKK